MYKVSEQHRLNLSLSHKGQIPWNKGTKGIMKAWNKGKKFPQYSGFNHVRWLGDKAKYVAKHAWVYRVLGQPTTCSNCGRSGLVGRKIHWANISKKYKRDINDWVRLCVPCHKNFDLGNICVSI